MRAKKFSDDAQAAERDGCLTCPRRRFLKWAFATGAGLSIGGSRADDSTAANALPQVGDSFVFAEGERANIEITPADLPLGGPQVLAWPMAPMTKTVRNGSRLSQVLLLRFDPSGLDEETRSRSAGGVVAYSAVCKHAQCPVTGWIQEKQVLHCYCHDSQYDPRHSAKVVFGPAPRSLPALPVKIVDGVLMAAGTFLGKVGQPKS
jgi:Rieske Fe-S protein